MSGVFALAKVSFVHSPYTCFEAYYIFHSLHLRPLRTLLRSRPATPSVSTDNLCHLCNNSLEHPFILKAYYTDTSVKSEKVTNIQWVTKSHRHCTITFGECIII